jgi:hypothetical protein
MESDADLRFTDILTTASAVANYVGSPTVTANHILDAIAILTGEKNMDSLGRGVSPLVRRGPPGHAGSADPAIRDLAQRWFAELGNDVTATLPPTSLETLKTELRALNAHQDSPLP